MCEPWEIAHPLDISLGKHRHQKTNKMHAQAQAPSALPTRLAPETAESSASERRTKGSVTRPPNCPTVVRACVGAWVDV